MSRHARLRIAGHPLHLIQRGVNRCACFDGDRDFELYLGLLGELGRRHGCAIHAYVLMTNHVHLLLSSNDPAAPSVLMKHLGQRYVQNFNRRHRRTGTLWEGRFRSSIVDSEAYLMRCQRYIEENPVRARMVRTPGDYAWSSYRANAEGLPSTIVTPHELYVALAASTASRHARYRELFATPPSDAELRFIRTAANAGLPLGRDEFIEALAQRLKRRVAFHRNGRPPRKPGTDLSFCQVETEVCPRFLPAGK